MKILPAFIFGLLLSSLHHLHAADQALDLCDVTWLWPAPQTLNDLEQSIAIEQLKTAQGNPVWTDEQFNDVLKTADSDFAAIQKFRIKLPANVRQKSAWRIVAFRVDPTAPGGHEIIRQNFGEKPQLRLILQPVTVENGKIKVHDIAVHLVYSFIDNPDGKSEAPDRTKFQALVHDLRALKESLAEDKIVTDSVPLGVHPGLENQTAGLLPQLKTFLARYLDAKDLSAMAIMGLDGPEPWIFVALGRLPGSKNFGPLPFLPAQMLSRRTGRLEVQPPPRVNNRNSVPNKFTMPADEKDRRGVATAALFESKLDLEALAVIGKDDAGNNVIDMDLRNKDIPDLIADPVRAHFFNTDCLSCHTETRRRLAFKIEPGKFAFKAQNKVPPIAPDNLPQNDWNVRNLGWFPGAKNMATVTQRTANETAEVVEYIKKHYPPDAAPLKPETSAKPTEPAKAEFDRTVQYLDQGWTDAERQDFYFVGQGSQLVPYEWFLHLEQAGNQELLRANKNMRALGFIPQEAERRRNPDGLPIGFVKDINLSGIAIKRGAMGKHFDQAAIPDTHHWLGFTCAACHTSELQVGQKTIRIDGGAAMADVESFLSQLAKALRETSDDDEKFSRFKERYQKTSESADLSTLRAELQAYTPVIEALVKRNQAKHPYGLGRLDAFGAILNQICAAGLEIPANERQSNAPVSFPFLWQTPELDWVQWNSSVENPIARNVGEVLGVFAHAKLTGTPAEGQFASSARVDLLHRLEAQIAQLQAPRWPEELLGKIDQAQAAQGKVLFEASCANCHNTRNAAGEYERTPANIFEKTFIKTTSIPFQEIGTDPQMVINFATRLADPGALKPHLLARLQSDAWLAQKPRILAVFQKLGKPAPDFDREVPASFLLKAAVDGVTSRYLQQEFINQPDAMKAAMAAELKGFRVDLPPPNMGMGYKARPLAGIWATAPYGHAGAVPNLYQWLLPEAERVKTFSVGNLEFDPRDVGFFTTPATAGFTFQVEAEGTPIPGNSNRGHSGKGFTDYTDPERRQLIEYLKTLR
jgi:mono/diheme cytochrome c family protein